MSRRKLSSAETATMDRLIGVKPTDTKVEAAEKGIAMAVAAFGENSRAVKEARRMLADYKAREMVS